MRWHSFRPEKIDDHNAEKRAPCRAQPVSCRCRSGYPCSTSPSIAQSHAAAGEVQMLAPMHWTRAQRQLVATTTDTMSCSIACPSLDAGSTRSSQSSGSKAAPSVLVSTQSPRRRTRTGLGIDVCKLLHRLMNTSTVQCLHSTVCCSRVIILDETVIVSLGLLEQVSISNVLGYRARPTALLLTFLSGMILTF